MKAFRLSSYAKVNIGLVFNGRREDGYHLLESYFQEIDLHDMLIIKEDRSGRFTLSSDRPGIPLDERNTVLKAINGLKPYLPDDLGAAIHLQKNIPDGAGLGGGSSNAAAVLRHFSQYGDFDQKELMALAANVGADVPFFLRGGLQFVSGIGEKLDRIEADPNLFFVLVFPDFAVSTAEAYKLLNFNLTKSKYLAKIPSFMTRPISWELFENAFEEVMIPAHPQIGEIKERLLSHGAVHAGLSGSGSTVYGICESGEQARTAYEDLRRDYSAQLSRPVIR